jgi:hypothetical protein
MSNEENTEVTIMTNRIARLKKRAAQSSELQELDDDEIFIGMLVDSQGTADSYGENYQIFTNDESGNHTVVSPAGWLKENLQTQGAEVGDLIAITFSGKKQSPAVRNYNAYSLIIDKA